MAMGMETSGYPVVVSGNNDSFGGMGSLGGVLLGSLLFGRGGWGAYGNGGGGYIPGAVEGSQSGQLAGIQAQVTGLQNQLNSNTLGAEMNELQSQFTSGVYATNQAVDNNSREILGQIGNVGTAVASGNFTTLQSLNGTQAAITAQNYNTSLQNLNSFNQLNTSVLQSFNELGRDQANSFNQVVMGQNALAAQMASCCCSIEQKIASDGNETRALINNLYVQNLQGQLADAKAQNSNLSQTIGLNAALNAQATTIINHLIPRPVV